MKQKQKNTKNASLEPFVIQKAAHIYEIKVRSYRIWKNIVQATFGLDNLKNSFLACKWRKVNDTNNNL